MTAAPMPEATKEDLEISKALAQRTQLPDGFDFRCHGPGCANVLRKPRVLTMGTTVRCTTRRGQHTDDVVPLRRVTWCWCSQECLDAWQSQLHLPGPHWEKYDQDGTLIGFIVQGRGLVPIEEIEAEADA